MDRFNIAKVISKVKNLDSRIAKVWDERDPACAYDELFAVLEDIKFVKEQLDRFMSFVESACDQDPNY